MRKLPQVPSSQPGTRKYRVLVVDAADLMARVSKRILGDQGYQIEDVATPAQAFERLVRQTYHIVLIDDSIDDEEIRILVKTMRRVMQNRAPVVILSDHVFGLSDDVSPVVFLHKPFSYDELVGRLAGLAAAVTG